MSHTVAAGLETSPMFPTPAYTTHIASAGSATSHIDDDSFVPIVFSHRPDSTADRTRRTVRRWMRRLRHTTPRITFER